MPAPEPDLKLRKRRAVAQTLGMHSLQGVMGEPAYRPAVGAAASSSWYRSENVVDLPWSLSEKCSEKTSCVSTVVVVSLVLLGIKTAEALECDFLYSGRSAAYMMAASPDEQALAKASA